MLVSEFDFLTIYRADLAGSRTLSFTDSWRHKRRYSHLRAMLLDMPRIYDKKVFSDLSKQ